MLRINKNSILLIQKCAQDITRAGGGTQQEILVAVQGSGVQSALDPVEVKL